jgi:hypothetical protein
MKNSTAFFIICVLVLIVAASGGGGKGGTTPTAASGSVTDIIQQTFGIYSGQALTIAKCESGYDPQAYNPTPVWVDGQAEHAMGVFQIIPSTFARVSSGNVYDASDNIQAAYKIFAQDGYSWREWECQP